MVLDLPYPTTSITSSFHFFPRYSHNSSDVPHFFYFKSSFKVFCQCPAFTSMQKDGPYVGFQSDFGVQSDISVGEDGLHLCECVFLDKAFFYLFVSHLAAGVIVNSKYLKVPV